MKIANPLVDTAFKHLMNIEDSKDVAISVLNAFIPDFKKCPIVDVSPLPVTEPVIVEDSKDKKQTFMDYHVKDQNGNSLIVELQRGRHINFDERALFHAAFTFAYFQGVESLKRENGKFITSNKWYKNLKKVYALQIVDYDSNLVRGIKDDCCDDRLYREAKKHPMKDDQYFKHYLFMDVMSGQKLDSIQLVQVELPRADKIKTLFPARKDFTLSEWWLSIFKHHDEYTPEYIKELTMRNVIPNEVLSGLRRLDFSYWTPNLIEEYKEDISSDAYSIQHNMWKQEGIEEGIEKGIEKGRAEIAKRMLVAGLDINQVAQISGLSVEQLQQL